MDIWSVDDILQYLVMEKPRFAPKRGKSGLEKIMHKVAPKVKGRKTKEINLEQEVVAKEESIGIVKYDFFIPVSGLDYKVNVKYTSSDEDELEVEVQPESQAPVSEKVEISCPDCSQSLRIPSSYEGSVRCPACTKIFKAHEGR